MSEPVTRQRLRDAREEAAAEREATETQRPSMYAAAVEAAVGVLPDMPTATVEQVVLAVLRVALPLHETQHADAWKAAHERAVHFELESVKANERAEAAEKEVQRYRGLDAAAKELLARNVELGTCADNAEAKCEDLEDEAARLRAKVAGLDGCLTAMAAAKGSNRYVGQGQLVTLLSLGDVREMISEWREAGCGDE